MGYSPFDARYDILQVLIAEADVFAPRPEARVAFGLFDQVVEARGERAEGSRIGG